LVWDCPDFGIIVIGSASFSIFGSLYFTHPIMVINFPLTEGKKKDKEHKMHKDRADYQAFKAGLPV